MKEGSKWRFEARQGADVPHEGVHHTHLLTAHMSPEP